MHYLTTRSVKVILAAAAAIFWIIATASPVAAAKRGGSRVAGTTHVRSHSGRARTTTRASGKSNHVRSYAGRAPSGSVARDANGRIARSPAAKRQFMRQTGYPKGRPGYVIDHIKPLACGGADAPANMQWQTVAAAKAKDKVERQGCQ
jgi:hypothetical protein